MASAPIFSQFLQESDSISHGVLLHQWIAVFVNKHRLALCVVLFVALNEVFVELGKSFSKLGRLIDTSQRACKIVRLIMQSGEIALEPGQPASRSLVSFNCCSNQNDRPLTETMYVLSKEV